jgi:hypothetical protein
MRNADQEYPGGTARPSAASSDRNGIARAARMFRNKGGPTIMNLIESGGASRSLR